MKKLIRKISIAALSLAACFFAPQVYAQVTFTSWAHPPEISLYASDTSAGIASSAAITLDDIYSDTINIGFTFNYFGTPQTQCVIGANGNICFNLSQANGYNPWPITAPLLGDSSALNSICGPWCDMDVVYGGEIAYFTYGTAPNRQFVANYCHDGMYTGTICPGQFTTAQIILYESTDVIEVHIANKTVCTAWNGGYAIVGVQNGSGSAATTAPGRDYPATWTATNEGWRFTPATGGTSYTVTSIPYANIPYYTVYWYDSSTGAYLGSGDSIVLTPAAPTTYKAVAVSCIDTGSTGVDTSGTGYMHLMPVVLGIGSMPSINQVSLYPNPAHDGLNITADGIINNITVCNLLGQTELSASYNAKQVLLNTSTLPPGVYLMKINGSVMRKFVKE